MSFLEINEEWIKDKVKITKEKLDDIKSLSLPGTYDEKIYKIGSSLNHFTRLKELDLSRNLLESLEGLEHLKCLESLNIYYNNVSLLKELYRLRSNNKLAQLDFRLNPVARNETDYRLCLIHMLPLLIRLDDRCVKDQERKAALMYFGSDQSREFSIGYDNLQDGGDRSVLPLRKTHPRVEMVNRWTKGIVKDDFFDTTQNGRNNLNLNLNDVNIDNINNMTAPRSSEFRSAKEYSPTDLQEFTNQRLYVERELSNDKQHSTLNSSTVPVYVRQDVTTPKIDKICEAHGDDGRGNLNIEDTVRRCHEDKYSSYPAHNKGFPPSLSNDTKIDYIFAKEVTDKICDLIDRHWNGNRSLHQHQTFITALSQILNAQVSNLSENSDIKKEIHYFKEIAIKLEEENIKLKKKFSDSRIYSKSSKKDDLEDIKHTNRDLKAEIRELKQKLDVSEKICEMSELLKESHDSLITTNEQLRRQISQQNKSSKSKGY